MNCYLELSNKNFFRCYQILKYMNFTYYKSCLLLLGGVCLSAIVSTPAKAIKNNKIDAYDQSSFTLAQTVKSNGQNDSREYTFKAPDSKKISNTDELVKVQGYKVEVYGAEQELLQQVKDIEPNAFIKGDTIQVGIFSKEANAQTLVQKLAIKGFWARIKTE